MPQIELDYENMLKQNDTREGVLNIPSCRSIIELEKDNLRPSIKVFDPILKEFKNNTVYHDNHVLEEQDKKEFDQSKNLLPFGKPHMAVSVAIVPNTYGKKNQMELNNYNMSPHVSNIIAKNNFTKYPTYNQLYQMNSISDVDETRFDMCSIEVDPTDNNSTKTENVNTPIGKTPMTCPKQFPSQFKFQS